MLEQGISDISERNILNFIRTKIDIMKAMIFYVGPYYKPTKKHEHIYEGPCAFCHTKGGIGFKINTEKQVFYCTGCNRGGDIVTYLCEIMGKSPVEVIKRMTRDAQLSLPEYIDYVFSKEKKKTEQAKIVFNNGRSIMVSLESALRCIDEDK